MDVNPSLSRRERLHEIIFEADTRAGRAFDVALLWSIVISVSAVLLESIEDIREQHVRILTSIEWFFTLLFTLEYAVRLWCVRRPFKYATSFYGLVDLLAILPTYLSLIMPGTTSLLVIRGLRTLRLFRVLKLRMFVNQAKELTTALRASRHKIAVFLFAVLNLVLVIGAIMYLVEGPRSGFTSIPKSMYWAIVTMTTVGYGDITPETTLGQSLSALVMILGYSILAVPTGIVSVELAHARKLAISTQVCPMCAAEGHDVDALHCKYCGVKL